MTLEEPMGLALLAARWILAGIFVRAGVVKAADLPDFRRAVANYRLLPEALVPAVSWFVPVAEIVVAACLAAGVQPVVSAAVMAAALLVFAAAIAVNLARGRSFDCGCGGSTAPSTISWWHVAADGGLAGLAVVIALAPPAGPDLWPGFRGPFSVPVAGSAAVPMFLTVVLLLLLWTVLGRAAAVRRAARATLTRIPSPQAGLPAPATSRRY